MTSDVRSGDAGSGGGGFCPVCHARVEAGKVCWLCKNPSTAENVFAEPGEHEGSRDSSASFYRGEKIDNPYATPIPIGETPPASIVSLILVLGLIVVLVSLMFAAPGLGILLSLIAAPALIRTAVVVGRRNRTRGEDMTASEKSALFMASFAGVFLAAIASAAAFGVTCAAACFGALAIGDATGGGNFLDVLLYGALTLSSITGLCVGGYTLYRLWRAKT